MAQLDGSAEVAWPEREASITAGLAALAAGHDPIANIFVPNAACPALGSSQRGADRERPTHDVRGSLAFRRSELPAMASPDDQPDDHSPSSMPLWIAVLCCAAAACLVFGNTIPALEDQKELSQLGTELDVVKRRYDNFIQSARLSGARGGPTAQLDLQSLFVAIDQKGYTIAEFCAAHASDEPLLQDRAGR